MPDAGLTRLGTAVQITPSLVAALVGACATGLIVLDSSMGTLRRLVFVVVLAAIVTGLAMLQARERKRSVAIVESVTGVLGLSIAAGYGVTHVIEGSVPPVVVGIAAAAGWLVTLMIGVAALARSASWPGRVVLVGAALIVAQFGVLPIAAGTAGTHPPRIAVSATAPAGARDVSIPATDGVPIGGWFLPGTNGAALVLLPGSGGNRDGVSRHAAILARHGYSVLALDARGSGTSGGIGNLWGWYGPDDVSGAISWLERQPGVDPMRIGLVGESMGAEQAMTVAALDRRVRTVIAEGVQGRVPADLWYDGDDPSSVVRRTVSTVMWVVAGAWSEAGPPPPLRDIATSLQVPTLIIAADAPDERAVAAGLSARGSLIEVWQTTGIGHTQSLSLAPAEWEARVIGFLSDTL
jgi:dienelactone hydrolase